MQLISFIHKHTALPQKSIESTVLLLIDDCTIPFIARYRKELTGNLDEVQIADIQKFKKLFNDLEARKLAILKSMEEQQVLTEELKLKIIACENLTDLEDIYLPYKKKRKTKADTARENGLEPLAKIIMAQNAQHLTSIAAQYINDKIANEKDALQGARHIIAEWINEHLGVRNRLRNLFARKSTITSKVIKAHISAPLNVHISAPLNVQTSTQFSSGNSSQISAEAQKYTDYFDWEEPLHRCPSHRLLAMLRAEQEKIVKIDVSIASEEAIQFIHEKLIRSDNECAQQIKLAADDSFKRLLAPALANEALTNAKEKADETAIKVFATNLRQLLLSPPLGEKTILAIDPGFKSGCKVVCLNRQGDLLHNENIYPHPPQNESTMAMKKISSLVNAYKIEAIAIGNGTASRETEQFIKRIRFTTDLQVFVVNEAGASVYSASKMARDEFPNYDVTVRGAVSIGRRLSDPLAELVKIDPKSIGVGQYQHDVNQTKLQEELDTVLMSCVNAVGVNINTASKPLLSSVSGIGEKLAENIIEYRTVNGAFTSRAAIKKVKRLGDKAYEQGAAFLRIVGAENPLDNSAVHPESYGIVLKIAKDLKVKVSDLIGNKSLLSGINLKDYCTDKVGIPTLTDIVKELEKPGLDPRKKVKIFEFDPTISTIKDLKIGQILPGIINNITNFGCFVDIGIKESGLVHISQVSNQFVSDINQVVTLQQQVKVKVLEVDIDRKRIQLSMNF